MTDAMATENSCRQMIGVTSFSRVWPQQEGIKATLLPPDIQRRHVCKQIVNPIAVWGVLLRVPHVRDGELSKQAPLCLALVIDTVEPNDSLEENVELLMARRVFGDLEERLEEVYNDLLEVIHQSTGFIDIEKSGDLDQPADVVGEQLVIHNPGGEFVPLVNGPAVDRNTPLDHLVFARFQIRDDFFCNLGEISSVDEVISLEEDGSQPRFSNRVVFKIELVKSMEGVDVGLQDISCRNKL